MKNKPLIRALKKRHRKMTKHQFQLTLYELHLQAQQFARENPHYYEEQSQQWPGWL